MEWTSAAVFVLVLSGTVGLLLRSSSWRTRALGRFGAEAAAEAVVVSPALIWRELVNWIGASVPASPKDVVGLKRRLIRAGFRDPAAIRVFQGARLLLIPIFTALGAFAVWQWELNLLVVPAAAM